MVNKYFVALPTVEINNCLQKKLKDPFQSESEINNLMTKQLEKKYISAGL